MKVSATCSNYKRARAALLLLTFCINKYKYKTKQSGGGILRFVSRHFFLNVQYIEKNFQYIKGHIYMYMWPHMACTVLIYLMRTTWQVTERKKLCRFHDLII